MATPARVNDDNERRERITARVPAGVRRTLEHAAELSGGTLNQFVVQAAVEKARAIIESAERIALTRRDAEVFFAALESPPAPNEALRAAVAEYKESPLFDSDRAAQ